MRRLVRVPEMQTPDPACLRVLRSLNSRLELVQLTHGNWWIGEVRESVASAREGQAQLRRLRAMRAAGRPVRAVAFWKAELMAQGFKLLAMVQSPLLSPSQCYAAVAPLLRATPQSVERALDAAVAESDGTTKRAASTAWLRDEYARYVGQDSYRHAFHRPIHSLPLPH